METIDYALNIIAENLLMERDRIIKELKKRAAENLTVIEPKEKDDDAGKLDNQNNMESKAYSGYNKANDYRIYSWITVKYQSKTYLITLCYDDANGGNFNTQVGRIQFWKDVKKVDNAYTVHEKGGNDKWYFCTEKADSSLDNDPIWIYEEDYTPGKVVNRFLDFIKYTI